MNVDRLKKALEFIASIPDEKIDLSTWQQHPQMDPDNAYRGPISANMAEAEQACGTLACAAGWIALSPEFQSFGFTVGRSGYPVLEYERTEHKGFRALAYMFDIEEHDAEDLFSFRRTWEALTFLSNNSFYGFMTDKQLWMTRMRNFLYENGVRD